MILYYHTSIPDYNIYINIQTTAIQNITYIISRFDYNHASTHLKVFLIAPIAINNLTHRGGLTILYPNAHL